MTKVEIDDWDCPICKKLTLAELDINTGKYTCYKCGKTFGIDVEDYNER